MNVLDELREILGVFADPATETNVTPSATHARIELVRDGEVKEYLMRLEDGAVEARHEEGRRFIGVDSLLASEEFADLRGLANTQKRILASKHADARILEPVFQYDGKRISRDDVLANISNHGDAHTRFVLLDGPAGIGKTFFLERLSWERANGYSMGKPSPPVLHVTSRGRRLFNLTEALAATTQILRARFTFEQVPILVRRGLLHLAIDGFDELIDADGYKDAWYALRAFLEEVGQGGTVVLAGRDTFFDQQQFYERLEGVKQGIKLVQVHLTPVSRESAVEWLRDRGWPEEDLESPRTDELLRKGSYLLRPYFLSKLAEADGWDDLLRQGTVRRFLVDRFLRREADILEKVAQKISQDELRKKLEEIFEEIALDMSERETDTVTTEFVALLCEVSFEESLEIHDVRKLSHKSSSLALLEMLEMDIDSRRRLRRFPHTELQYYFLARGIVSKLVKGHLPVVLRRGVLGMDFLEVFVEELQQETAERARKCMSRLRAFMEHEPAGDRLQYNGTSMLLASLVRPEVCDFGELSELVANEAILATASPTVRLSKVSIGRLDVRGSDLSTVQFDDCVASMLIADELTRFGSTYPKAHGLHVDGREASQTYWDPVEIESWLREHSRGVSPESTGSDGARLDDIALPLMRYFERVCRKALRQFYIREGEEDPGSQLLEDPMWPEIERILDAENRLDRVIKPMHGQRAALVRIVDPRSLLEPGPADEISQRIREKVLERARDLVR